MVTHTLSHTLDTLGYPLHLSPLTHYSEDYSFIVSFFYSYKHSKWYRQHCNNSTQRRVTVHSTEPPRYLAAQRPTSDRTAAISDVHRHLSQRTVSMHGRYCPLSTFRCVQSRRSVSIVVTRVQSVPIRADRACDVTLLCVCMCYHRVSIYVLVVVPRTQAVRLQSPRTCTWLCSSR